MRERSGKQSSTSGEAGSFLFKKLEHVEKFDSAQLFLSCGQLKRILGLCCNIFACCMVAHNI